MQPVICTVPDIIPMHPDAPESVDDVPKTGESVVVSSMALIQEHQRAMAKRNKDANKKRKDREEDNEMIVSVPKAQRALPPRLRFKGDRKAWSKKFPAAATEDQPPIETAVSAGNTTTFARLDGSLNRSTTDTSIGGTDGSDGEQCDEDLTPTNTPKKRLPPSSSRTPVQNEVGVADSIPEAASTALSIATNSGATTSGESKSARLGTSKDTVEADSQKLASATCDNHPSASSTSANKIPPIRIPSLRDRMKLRGQATERTGEKNPTTSSASATLAAAEGATTTETDQTDVPAPRADVSSHATVASTTNNDNSAAPATPESHSRLPAIQVPVSDSDSAAKPTVLQSISAPVKLTSSTPRDEKTEGKSPRGKENNAVVPELKSASAVVVAAPIRRSQRLQKEKRGDKEVVRVDEVSRLDA